MTGEIIVSIALFNKIFEKYTMSSSSLSTSSNSINFDELNLGIELDVDSIASLNLSLAGSGALTEIDFTPTSDDVSK